MPVKEIVSDKNYTFLKDKLQTIDFYPLDKSDNDRLTAMATWYIQMACAVVFFFCIAANKMFIIPHYHTALFLKYIVYAIYKQCTELSACVSLSHSIFRVTNKTVQCNVHWCKYYMIPFWTDSSKKTRLYASFSSMTVHYKRLREFSAQIDED